MDVRLERFTAEHLPHAARLMADPAVVRYTRLPSPMPDGFPQEWLARYEAGREDGTRELFALSVGAGSVAGVCMAMIADPRTQEAELGYLVDPALAGRGIATSALRQLTRWCFEERGLVRLTLLTAMPNVASQKVAERAGYSREGVLRSVFTRPGVRDDAILWSRLASDPEPAR